MIFDPTSEFCGDSEFSPADADKICPDVPVKMARDSAVCLNVLCWLRIDSKKGHLLGIRFGLSPPHPHPHTHLPRNLFAVHKGFVLKFIGIYRRNIVFGDAAVGDKFTCTRAQENILDPRDLFPVPAMPSENFSH